jgi:hypothetical protein
MADHREPIRQAIQALEGQQRQLAADLAALRRILARDDEPAQPPPSDEDSNLTGDQKPAREPSARGAAEREIAEILADGQWHMPAEIGRARGTSSNAASNVLRRMRKKGLVVTDGAGKYRLPTADDSQGSLPVPGGDSDSREKGGGS